MTEMYVQTNSGGLSGGTPTGGIPTAGQPGTAQDEDQSPVSATMDTVADQAGELKHQAGQEVGAVVDTAKSQAGDLADETRRRIRAEANNLTERAAEMIKESADELTAMASSAQDPGPAAQVVRTVGERAESVAERLRRDGYQGMARDMSNWARKNPGLFLFAAAGTGFVLGRVFRSVDTKGVAEVVRGNGSASSSYDSDVMPYEATMPPDLITPGTAGAPGIGAMTPPADAAPLTAPQPYPAATPPVVDLSDPAGQATPPSGGPAQYPGA